MYEPYDTYSERMAHDQHTVEARKEKHSAPMTDLLALTTKESQELIDTLLNPPGPSPTLVAAADEYKEVMGQRRCGFCNQVKPSSDFYADIGKNARRTCKSCENTRRKETRKPRTTKPKEAKVVPEKRVYTHKDFSTNEVNEIIEFWRGDTPVNDIAKAFNVNPTNIYIVLRENIPSEYLAKRIANYIRDKHNGQPIVGYALMQNMKISNKEISDALAHSSSELYDYVVTKQDKPWIKTRWVELKDPNQTYGEVIAVDTSTQGEEPVISRSMAIEDRFKNRSRAERDANSDMPTPAPEHSAPERTVEAKKTVRGGSPLYQADGSTTRRPDLTTDVRNEICRMYTAGESTDAIEKKFQITNGSLYRILRNKGVPSSRTKHNQYTKAATTPTKPAPEDSWLVLDTAPRGENHSEPTSGQRWFIRARVQSEVTFSINADSMQDAMTLAESYDVFTNPAQPFGTPSIKLVGLTLED